jgi:hypothetical protein
VTLGVGLALLAAASAMALTRSPPRVVRTGQQEGALVASTTAAAVGCQTGETLPADVSGIRVSIWAFFGTSVHVAVYSGSHVLTEGSRGPDWTGSTVTVPVTPLHHAVSPVKVCFRVGPDSEILYFLGAQASPAEATIGTAGQQLAGRMDFEYLAAGQGSWWSRIGQVANHMGLGHALTGVWVVLLVLALMAATGVLAVRLVLRELA